MTEKLLATYGPQIAWMAASFGCGAAYAYQYTFGLDSYKEKVMDRLQGVPVKADLELLLLAEEIKKHFKWQDSLLHRNKSMEFIQTKNLLDISHKGSMKTVFGAVVSLPAMLASNSLKTAQQSPAVLLRYGIDVDTQKGQEILNTFKLSKAARKFALAKEMCNANSYQIHVNLVGTIFSIMSCYILSTSISQLIPLRGAKFFSYVTVIPSVGFAALKCADSYNCKLQAKSDRKAASIDQEVALGGIEYYTALIARQKTLETIKKQEDGKPEAASNTGIRWRKKELSWEERREHLLKVVKKLYPDVSL